MDTLSRRQFTRGIAAAAFLRTLPPLASDSKSDLRAALAGHDRAVLVRSEWMRDPMIALAKNGYYYLTGTTLAPDGPATLPFGARNPAGWWVRVWRSQDLVNWESLGPVASLKDTAYYTVGREIFDQNPENMWKVWAPEIHQREDGRWGLVFTVPPPLRPKVGGVLMLSETSDIHGPWSNPMGAHVGLRHDPSLFCDDHGTWWMIWGNTGLAPLKPDWSGYAAPPIDIHPSDAVALGHEGCTLLKIEGKYVLFGTGWSTSEWRKGSYNLYCATADKVTGPYGKRRLVGRFLGHGTPFMDKQGKWWCTAFPNTNHSPLPLDGIEKRDLRRDAETINPEGMTLVPLSVHRVHGDIEVRAIDPHYAVPGPDEAPTWTGKIEIG